MDGDVRRLRAFEAIRGRGELKVQDLIAELGVSGMTIRRDLSVLEQQRLIRRAYGKVYWIAEEDGKATSFEQRSVVQSEAKHRIARLAIQCLQDSTSIFLDGSTTCREVARVLAPSRRLTVYTNSLAVVQEIRALPHIQTFILGGYLCEDRNSLDSDATLALARQIFVDTAFVSCSGYSTRGLVNNGLPESKLKGIMMANAGRTCLLADHSKWNARALFNISAWDSIDVFITDREVDPVLAKILRAKNVQVQWPKEAVGPQKKICPDIYCCEKNHESGLRGDS